MTQTIALIDYGSGNLRSAAKALERVVAQEGLMAEVVVTDKAEIVAAADRIVLPGQGAFGDCMAGLSKLDGMLPALEEAVLKKARPFLGICVGMQLMASRGLEYGVHEGLGWIGGEVVKMTPLDPSLKIPHMGWNTAALKDHPVLRGITKKCGETEPHFYFVHSFMFQCKDPSHVLAVTDYGGPIAAIVGRDNMIGVQFHPEKSQLAGLALLEGFLRWTA